jgi:hypothetical protein
MGCNSLTHQIANQLIQLIIKDNFCQGSVPSAQISVFIKFKESSEFKKSNQIQNYNCIFWTGWRQQMNSQVKFSQISFCDRMGLCFFSS